MSRSAFPFASLLVAVALSVPAGQASAQSLGGLVDRGTRDVGDRASRMDDRHNNDGRHNNRGEDHRALSDAVRRVERRTGGQVLSAERVPFDGRNVNRVKVIDSSGRVRVYMDDPQGRQPPRDRGEDD